VCIGSLLCIFVIVVPCVVDGLPERVVLVYCFYFSGKFFSGVVFVGRCVLGYVYFWIFQSVAYSGG
jgi:hypothetical protein